MHRCCSQLELGRRRWAILELGLVAALLWVAGSGTSVAQGDRRADRAEQTRSKVIRVGKSQQVRTVAEASRLARDGDTVEIETGAYSADVAVWEQKDLTIRGVNGRAELRAAGAAAEGKAIWVVRGGAILIENIAFSGTTVPDLNGAGIRFERGRLTIRNCVFSDNENGILAGNDPSLVLEIEDSEFANNGAGDGRSHNLYVGSIGKFSVTGSYFHHANVGHLLKTRARENFIYYNRLSDEPGGTASYELEFPSGGFAVVVGNLIEQGSETENSTIVSFGAEGYRWPRNELYLAHNTIVNDRSRGGTFVAAYPGAAFVKAINNVFVGKGDLAVKARNEFQSNWNLTWPDFAMPTRLDFRLKKNSKAVGAAADPGEIEGFSLRPVKEYLFPVGTTPIPPGGRLSPGAFQTVVP